MKIIAIGGGSCSAGDTLPMDQELIRLSGHPQPKLLFIPTASDDDQGYVEGVTGLYKSLGCETDALLLWSPDDADAGIAKSKIESADIVYVGGGNTKKMLELWRSLGVDRMLAAHLGAGKPVGGVSAGAICWFSLGNSDWPRYEGIPGVNTAPLEGLGFVDLAVCPHTKNESFRLSEFRSMMQRFTGPGVGVDDCCAIQIEGDSYRILSSAADSVAHLIEWWDGTLHESVLQPHSDFRPLEALKGRAQTA